MKGKIAVVSAAVVLLATGCAPTSSSKVTGTAQPTFEGEVLVSQQQTPSDVDHKVIGTVKARARSGYDSVESLYPLLAEEARKIGANAVVGVEGGRRPSAFSWAAPFASGTAIRVDDQQALEELDGTYH